MKTILDLIFLTIIVCYIEDCSGFIQSVKRQFLRKVMKVRKPDASTLNWPPFDCSRCMSFYSGLIYLLILGKFTLGYIVFVSLLSLLSSNISGFLLTIKDYLATFENWLEKIIQN